MKSILLVEDTVSLAEEIGDILRLEGYRVEIVNNGNQGITYLEDAEPDLIITDLLMPEMDGLEFIRNVRSMPMFDLIPIIILSARTSEEDKKDGQQAGANAFLGKPCDIVEMLTLVKTLIR